MKDKKVLLITGASSEVGCSLIEKVIDDYNAIWAHFNSSDQQLERLKERFGEKIIPIQADFSDLKSTEKMIDYIIQDNRTPDHIVHLAALKAYNLQFHKYKWLDYQMGVDTSLRSIVMILERLIPKMRKQKYGKIIFLLTSCILGGVPPKYQSPYITIKYALHGLMKSLAAEYADQGITINAVSPDMMETKFLSKIEDIIIRQNAEKNPLGRNITVDDVIPAIVYLLSEEAAAVTGQNIGVTGGVR